MVRTKKTMIICLCLLLFIGIFAACGGASDAEEIIVANAQIDIGTSARFSQEEITSAVDAVIEHIRDNFTRWDELTALWYDESWSDGDIARSGFNKENTIVLRSEIYLGQGLGNDALWTPLHWVLVRGDSSDSWAVHGVGKG